jgi:hypothetical protein
VEGERLVVRYFVTYRGIRPPAVLVDPLNEADLRNRNTFVRGHFDSKDRLVAFEMVVYGQVDLAHRYAYRDEGTLQQAVITVGDEEPITLDFDEVGRPALPP